VIPTKFLNSIEDGEFIARAWLFGRGFLIGEMFFGGRNRIADLPVRGG
jgi:hypothetical protein